MKSYALVLLWAVFRLTHAKSVHLEGHFRTNKGVEDFFVLARHFSQTNLNPKCSTTFLTSESMSLSTSEVNTLVEGNGHPSAHYRFQSGPPPPPADVNSTEVSPRVLSGCLFFVTVASDPESVGHLVGWAEDSSHIQMNKDLFLIWTENGNAHDVLMSPGVSDIKYKVAVDYNPESNRLKLYSTCFFCESGEPSVVPIGTYVANETRIELEKKWKTMYPDLTRNLHGRKVKGTYMYDFNREGVRALLKNPESNEVDQVFVITEAVGTSMNYDWEVFESEGGAADLVAGFVNPNSPGPIIRSVQRGEADYCPAMLLTGAMIPNSELGTIIDSDYLGFLVGRPRRYFSWTTVIEPFSLQLWILIMTFVVIGSATLTFLMCNSVTSERQMPRDAFPRAIGFTLSSLVEQLVPLPSTLPVRIVAACWWLLAIVFATLYKSRLFSCLTFPPIEVLPQSAAEFVQEGYTILATFNHITFFNILTMDKTDPLTVYLKHHIAPVESLEACVQRVIEQRKAACISVPIVLFPLQQSFLDVQGVPCTRLIRDTNYGYYAFVPVRKESPWSNAFAHAVLRYIESYILERWNTHNIQRRRLIELNSHGGSSCQSEEERSPLTFFQLCGPFILLVLGTAISLVVFVLEGIVYGVMRKVRVRPIIIAPYPFLK